MRKVVVNSGRDPRDFVLYSFGGAGPMHCASFAADLGVAEVLVPMGSTAAVFSAYGLASSDIVLNAERSQPENFPPAPARLQAIFSALEAELATQLTDQGLSFTKVSFEREVDVRYTMQLAEVTTPISAGPLDEAAILAIGEAFENRYAQLYGKDAGFRDAGMQFITYRVRARGCLPIRPELPLCEKRAMAAQPRATRPVFLDVRRGFEPTHIYDYRDLGLDDALRGPAIVEAPTTTVAIPHGCDATLDRLGNLVIRYAACV